MLKKNNLWDNKGMNKIFCFFRMYEYKERPKQRSVKTGDESESEKGGMVKGVLSATK
jgi:hypothetical protein